MDMNSGKWIFPLPVVSASLNISLTSLASEFKPGKTNYTPTSTHQKYVTFGQKLLFLLFFFFPTTKRTLTELLQNSFQARLCDVAIFLSIKHDKSLLKLVQLIIVQSERIGLNKRKFRTLIREVERERERERVHKILTSRLTFLLPCCRQK